MIAVRYIRFRHGGCSTPSDCIAKAGTGSGNVSNSRNSSARVGHIIYDHVSTAWTNDENINFWTAGGPSNPINHVTVQRSIMAEGLKSHSAGAIFGGTNSVDGHEVVDRMSWHHNYFANNSSRNPSGSAGNAQRDRTRGVEIVNNVVYAWGASISRHWKNSVIDWVNNHWRKFGPCPNNAKVRHNLSGAGAPSFHISGNIADGDCSMPSDQWKWLRTDSRPYDVLPTAWQRSTRLAQPARPITVEPASAVWGSVLGDVGANQRLDCSGNWVGASDAVDQRLINQAWQGTQDPIPDQPGPFPSIATGTACADGDGDGMPDTWETQNGLDPADASDAWTDTDGDGYWNIEEYLNGTAP